MGTVPYRVLCSTKALVVALPRARAPDAGSRIHQEMRDSDRVERRPLDGNGIDEGRRYPLVHVPELDSESDADPSRLQHATAAGRSNELRFRRHGEPITTADEHALGLGFDHHEAIAGVAGAHDHDCPRRELPNVHALLLAE